MGTADFGYMQNVGVRDAVGGSLYLGLDGVGLRYGLVARYRRFLSRGIALDLNIGLLWGLHAIRGGSLGSGYLIQSGLSLDDWVSLMIHAQITDYVVAEYNGSPIHESHTSLEWFAGLRFGSYLAPAVPVAAFAVFLVAYAAGEIE